jgi:DNA-binding GntR family transcriptional regulator
MAVFHLQCVVHRGCVSGIALEVEQITARTDAEAISEAEARFARLLGARTGLAVLKDDASRIVWTSQCPGASDASAAVAPTERQAPSSSDIGATRGEIS